MSTKSSEHSLNTPGLRRRTNLLQRSRSDPSTQSSKTTASSYAMVENPMKTDEFDSFISTPHSDPEKSLRSEANNQMSPSEDISDDSTSESGPESVKSKTSESAHGEDSSVGNAIEEHQENRGAKPTSTPDGNTTTKRHVRIAPPKLNTNLRRSSQRSGRGTPRSPISPTTRAWYEFDLAVVVALVSPIGNWLTGGDHVKNLLLVTLLIFYLHQLIEVPWTLYHTCRSRHSIPSSHPSSSYASSLYSLELFFLSLTIISPLLGALLLRTVGSAIVGPDALSWFNVTLFVLSTGLRPWRHLVQRMTTTAEEMQGIVCEGACGDRHRGQKDPSQEAGDDSHANERAKQTDLLLQRIESLEKELLKMKTRMSVRQEEVYDYVDEAVEEVDKRIREAEDRLVKTMRDVDEVGAYLRQWGKSYSATYLEFLPRWIVHTLSIPFASDSQRTPTNRPASMRPNGNTTHARIEQAGRSSHHTNNASHRSSSSTSAHTLRTLSAYSSKSALKTPSPTTKHNSPQHSMYTSPCGSSVHSKLDPIPEEDGMNSPTTTPAFTQSHTPNGNGAQSKPLPMPTIIKSPPQYSGPVEFVGSIVFLPFRIARGVLSWGLGYT